MSNLPFKAQAAPILNFSGEKKVFSDKKVRVLKKHQYIVFKERISGNAPKDFIKVYEYGRSRKKNRKQWIPYISKIGHKWYPVESITEQLLTRLGQEWGFNMADSKLYVVTGQLRFCSEYFLKHDQELVHGADILSRYLQEDNPALIEDIDKKGWSQELLTFQFVKNAIFSIFPQQANRINGCFVDLLLLDAIVGNNDRHFFNWGIIRHLRNTHEPKFSPVYDTARGLFWNITEKKLLTLQRNSNDLNNFFTKYHKKSKPKIGWENMKEINHYELVERMVVDKVCSLEKAQKLFSDSNLGKAEKLLKTEFNSLLSQARIDLILRYLNYRFSEFSRLIK